MNGCAGSRTVRAVERGLSRRRLLERAVALGAGGMVADLLAPARYLAAAGAAQAGAVAVANPLTRYPERGWESVYRDLFAEDDSFVFTCAPNDTHNCLLRAHTKNGVIVRISPTYGYGRATDLEGNQASHRWDPRTCQKGLILARRFYGDRRVKAPMVRAGFKEWADAGFPRDDDGRPRMDTRKRGYDTFLRVGWDEAVDIAARTILDVARTYGGPEGAGLLRDQGYEPEMVEAMHEAGVQAIKMRGGMPLLGVGRVFGFYRFANMLALLDRKLRPHVSDDEVVGSRGFDNYAWHTDLPPGHPMVTGSQTVDFDLFAVEHAKLVVLLGMNWICTKMPEGHWLGSARVPLVPRRQAPRRPGTRSSRPRRGVPRRGGHVPRRAPRALAARVLRPARGRDRLAVLPGARAPRPALRAGGARAARARAGAAPAGPTAARESPTSSGAARPEAVSAGRVMRRPRGEA